MAYVIISPAYSEFRAGEPIAYKIAESVLKEATKSTFTKKYQIKKRSGNEWETVVDATVTAKGDTIEVVLKKGQEPFVFLMEEV